MSIIDTLAQDSVPTFEMKLYFMDALGNRDTLEVGYDTSAGNTINPQFGEVAINAPFDAVFEVRATHEWGEATLKRIIDRSEYGISSGCESSNGIWIFFSAQNFPITVTYDSSILNNTPCHTDAVLSPSWTLFALPEWWDAEVLYCLSNTDQITDDFEYVDLTREFEVEGKGMQDLPGYFFVIFWPAGYCQSLVNTFTISQTGASIYPNPAKDYLTISFQDDRENAISLVNAYGQIVWGPQQVYNKEFTLNTDELASGQYYLRIKSEYHVNLQKVAIVK